MESIYPELALCVSINECAGTDTVILSISEVSEGTVSLEADFIPVREKGGGWLKSRNCCIALHGGRGGLKTPKRLCII